MLPWIPRTFCPTAELNEVVERTINLQLGVLELCCLCLPRTDPELWRSVKTELCTRLPLTWPASELNGTVGHHFGVHWWTWVMWESPRYLVTVCCVLSIDSYSKQRNLHLPAVYKWERLIAWAKSIFISSENIQQYFYIFVLWTIYKNQESMLNLVKWLLGSYYDSHIVCLPWFIVLNYINELAIFLE